MLTGTPLDLTPFGAVLQGIGLLYWLFVFAVLALILFKVKGKWVKSLSAIVVLAIMVVPVAIDVWQKNKQHQEVKARYDDAMSRFNTLCKDAGEKVYRTVDDVEGILLMNVRPEQTSESQGNPNWADAGLPHESAGEGYLRTFLLWENHDDKRSPRGFLTSVISELPGYAFVDVPEENGTVFRNRFIKGEDQKHASGMIFAGTRLSREIVQGKPARYAVSFVNYSDPEDRKKWIAGTKVTITDTLNNDVIAEKTWYSVEPGQGSKEGFRSPWGFAQNCPKNTERGSATRFFVDQILKPKKAE